MILDRIRRKGQRDKYVVREGVVREGEGGGFRGYTFAYLERPFSGRGWNGTRPVEMFSTWHPTLASALRFYENQAIEARVLDKLEAVL